MRPNELAMDHFMSVPLRQMAYQPFGDVEIEFAGHEPRRALPPVARPRHRDRHAQRTASNGVTYTRQALASYPDRAIVVQLNCDQPGSAGVHRAH